MAATIGVMRTLTPASTGDADFTISGIFGGANAKGAIVICGRATADGTAATTASMGLGFTDGTNHAFTAIENATGQGTSDTYSYAADDGNLIRTKPGLGGSSAIATFVSFIADGIRLNFSVAGVQHLVTIILFGGSDLTCAVGDTTQGNPTSTMTPGFRADAIFGAAVNRAFIESAAAGGTISLGFVGRKSDGTITQGSVSLASQDNVAQAELSGVSSDDSWLSWPTVDSTTIDTQAQVTSITSTQFVSTLKTGTTAVPFGWLACNFNDTMYAEVKAIDPPVSAVSSATSGFSVAPVFGAILGTMLQAYDTGDNSGDSGVLMLGTFTGTGAQFAYEIQDEDESDPTDSDTVSDDAAVYLNDHTGASAFRGSLTSMDATGWTINYSAANGTQRKWVALAIGPAAGAGPSSPFLQSKKRFFLHGVRK